MTTIVDGTTGITFPSTISGVSATQQYSGRILQVVSNFSASQITTTSTSFVTTGFSLSITPINSSSKILAMFSGMMYSNTTTAEPQIALYRGGSSLGTFTDMYSSAGPIIAGHSFMYLDSPATTSSTTYTLYFKQGNTGSGGTIYIGPNSTTFGIILQEIAA
jgi:hypothetical protein